MGYETTLLVGTDTGHAFGGEGTYFQVIATIDLCKLGNSATAALPWKNKTPDVKSWYWYAQTGDGNNHVSTDLYGDQPQPVPISHVIAALEADMQKDDYRRLKWAHSLLMAIYESAGGENFSVLVWGH